MPLHQSWSSNVHRRRPVGGFSLIEVVIAMSLLATMFGLVGMMIARVRSATDLQNQRRLAFQILENALEQASAATRRGESIIPLERSPEDSSLMNARLITQLGEQDDLGFTAVSVTLHWTNATGQPSAPVSLTAWLPTVNSEVAP